MKLKHLPSLLCVFLFSNLSVGQTAQLSAHTPQSTDGVEWKDARHPSSKSNANNYQLRNGTIYFSEDFNGIGTFPNSTPGPNFTTVNGTWTTGGPDADIWKHSFFGTSGEWSTGTPEPQFTSVINGFMLFDVDSANFVVSPNYVDRSGTLTLPVVDLSSAPTVHLIYQQFLRHCCGTMQLGVEVSTDAGITWTYFDVLGGLPVNTTASNPDTVDVDISPVAAGQPAVLIRFSWSGVGMTHYFWAIDDVNLCELGIGGGGGGGANNDIAITDVEPTNSHHYPIVPMSQVVGLGFCAEITNLDINTQTNVTLSTEVLDGGLNAVHNAISNTIPSFPAAVVDTLCASPLFLPANIDTYTITYTANQNEVDGNPANNVWQELLTVSDTVYAREDGNFSGTLWNGGNSYEMGNVFNMVNSDVATSISFFVDAGSDVGSQVNVALYDHNFFTLLGTSTNYTIQTGDLGGLVTLSFTAPINVTGGTEVVAVVNYSSGGLNGLLVPNGGNNAPQLTSYINDQGTWYYMTSIPAVRLNLGSGGLQSLPGIVDASCFGYCNGSVSLTTTGGVAPYQYSMDGGVTFQAGNSFSNLCAGIYTVLVVDANGSDVWVPLTIGEPTELEINLGAIAPSCGQCDGEVAANVLGGTPPYTYAWSNGGALSSINNVCQGWPFNTVYVTDNNGCSIGDSTIFFTLTCDSVWPGDTDYDGFADNNDLLPIGLAYNTTGPVRTGATINWIGQVATNWSDTLTTGVNHKHADTDGSGLVEDADTTAILTNYGYVHGPSAWKNRGGPTDPLMYIDIPVDSVGINTPLSIDVNLGTFGMPADSIYGLAFTINYDTALVNDAEPIYFDASNSWIGTLGVDMIAIDYNILSLGQLDVAMTRTDHQNVSGYGGIGTFNVVTTDNLSGFKALAVDTSKIYITDVTIVGKDGEEHFVNLLEDSVIVVDYSVGIQEVLHNEQVRVYPNPMTNYATILLEDVDASTALRFELYDVLGNLVQQQTVTGNRLLVHRGRLAGGMYTYKIYTNDHPFANGKMILD